MTWRGVKRAWARCEAPLLGSAGLALFVGGWELVARWHWVDPIVLSSPSRVLAAVARQWNAGELPRDLAWTLTEFAVGFGLAAAVGMVLGILMGLYRTLEHALDPFVWTLYAAPLVALYPLFIVWFGFGFPTVVALTFVLTVTPITVNALAALRSVDPVLVRAVRAFGGRQRDVVLKVIVPASLPLALAGLRIGVGRALVGVVVGEMFGANAGLGFRMAFYAARLRTTDVLVAVVAIVAVGVLGTQTMRALEHRLARWRAT
jgi:NitT/TauT family transport system permease protein